MRLFQINDLHTHKVAAGFFPTKLEAKQVRALMNQDGTKYYVAPGPDHRRYKK